MFKYCYILLLILIVYVQVCYLEVSDERANNENSNLEDGRTALYEQPRRRCPLCDSSVFSYCTDKLFHDSCCCNNPQNPYYPLPRQCQFADCSFLHANSCQEHKLITACCCISHFNFVHRN
ncbi:hypothetical protein ILUMI_21486 [Ignelater luminosus]|uniref:CCC domain-containing protein n=1 Tax=Ignelater luminosus TaxID=2038154 RepID=A0A8K0CEG8_IGNLU|nr:hypothetical protein ILUMI_21486 [Ignelater luminosus]